MTPHERAEKTVQTFRDGQGYNGNDKYLAGLIAAEIEYATTEAYAMAYAKGYALGRLDGSERCEQHTVKAAAEAYEECAKIAETWDRLQHSNSEIVEEIRAKLRNLNPNGLPTVDGGGDPLQ